MLVKKMSVGTVRGGGGKSEMNKPNQKSMSSSFFLYKIHADEAQRNRDAIQKRQTRTSGGSRGRPSQIEEELKYFARSKIGSFSDLH